MPGINDIIPDVRTGDPMKAEWAQHVGQNLNRLMQADRGQMEHLLYNGAGIFTSNDLPDDLVIYNGDASNTIPAYGVVLHDGVSTDVPPLPQVKRPDSYGCQTNFFVNDFSSIGTSTSGVAQKPIDGRGLYIVQWDTTDGLTPSKNEMWGVQNGSYLIRKNYAGFRVFGVYDLANHLALVQSEPCYTIRGEVLTSDVASGATGILTIFVGNGLATQPAGNPTLTNVLNDSSCVVKANKPSRVHWNPDNLQWQWQDARTV